jgi:FtsH-binding integral membrane protein
MVNKFNRGTAIQGRTVSNVQVDEGLRSHMLRVYNYMTIGLALTGLVAYLVASTPALVGAIIGSPIMWVLLIGNLGLVMFLSARIHAMKFATAQLMFWAYAALNGVTFSIFFVAYTQESIARVFFITAASFAALSLYGYSTKRNLSGMRSFLVMGMVGIFIAFIVNIWLQSPIIYLAASAIGVLVFAGLTAYDTQKIKEMYYELDSSEITGKKAIMGALSLYLDFILMFQMLMHLFGNRN